MLLHPKVAKRRVGGVAPLTTSSAVNDTDGLYLSKRVIISGVSKLAFDRLVRVPSLLKPPGRIADWVLLSTPPSSCCRRSSLQMGFVGFWPNFRHLVFDGGFRFALISWPQDFKGFIFVLMLRPLGFDGLFLTSWGRISNSTSYSDSSSESTSSS